MGGTFDYFGELSHPDYTCITSQQYANRMLLIDVMIRHGFKPLAEEWYQFVYCSGDINPGMQYNKMVSISQYPTLDTKNSEHLIDYTRQYQYCLNISYNDTCIPGLGSSIFLHCMGPKKPYTGGYIAISENQMMVIIQNVKPDCTFIIDILENLLGNL